MSNLTVDGTSTWISGTNDTRTVLSDGPTGDVGVVAQINGTTKFALDVQTVLGNASTLKGTATDLASRLAVLLAANGSLQSGITFPVSPPPVMGQLFYRTDLQIVYVYDTSTAQWQVAFQSNIYALLDGTSNFTGSLTIKASAPGVRLIGQEANAKDWYIRESGGRLHTYLNTGTEAAPVFVEDNFFVPTGGSIAYGGSVAPVGWLLCDGAAYSRVTYARLFAVIGTTFGVGDGSTTFNVQDKRGRTSIGLDGGTNRITSASVGGANANTLGGTGGAETHTLTTAQEAPHQHSTGTAIAVGGTGSGFAAGGLGSGITQITGSTGGGAAHNNTQPWLAENWIVKT